MNNITIHSTYGFIVPPSYDLEAIVLFLRDAGVNIKSEIQTEEYYRYKQTFVSPTDEQDLQSFKDFAKDLFPNVYVGEHMSFDGNFYFVPSIIDD